MKWQAPVISSYDELSSILILNDTTEALSWLPVHSLTPRIIRDKLRERARNRLPVANDFRGTWPACHWFTGPLSNTDGVRATACFLENLINLFSNFQPIAIVHKLEKIEQKITYGEKEFDSSRRETFIINMTDMFWFLQYSLSFSKSRMIFFTNTTVHVPVSKSVLYIQKQTPNGHLLIVLFTYVGFFSKLLISCR